MNEQEQQYAIAQFTAQNSSESALQIRLVTQQHLMDIENMLRGVRETVVDENGVPSVKLIKIGTPYANEEGVQGIMKWVRGVINPHFVQGNFPVEKGGVSTVYNDFIKHFQIDFGTDLVLNCGEWGIPDKKIEGLIDCIMSEIRGFASRLIANKERDSYGLTMKTVDTSTIQQKNKGLFK